jgi:hypothetical protein
MSNAEDRMTRTIVTVEVLLGVLIAGVVVGVIFGIRAFL